jgi:hypothetical protein
MGPQVFKALTKSGNITFDYLINGFTILLPLPLPVSVTATIAW